MKTSSTWLRDYIDIDWDARQLAEELTMVGLEVEGIEEKGALPDSVVVARIESREQHPDADRLSLCKVDDGSGELLDVVCGAPNCDTGKLAVLARVGTLLPNGVKLKKSKIRGQVSMGMLCAQDELGLGDDHDGIIIIDGEAAIGTAYREVIGTDTVIDWEVTPNRPDWLSHIGIAREIGAVTGAELRMPAVDTAAAAGTDIAGEFKVTVADADLCPRYTARLIKDVTVGASPDWMQAYLRAVGLRPINNIVDITNFVLFECGQPLHAFDCDRLNGDELIIRRAGDGEVITTLDDSKHKLTTANLLIADAAGAVALAGVMGGQNSEINDDTTGVLLESAAFDPGNIRATSRQLELSTDSSYRFERGVDVEMVDYASRRAAQLICEYAGGTLIEDVIDVRQVPYSPPQLSCRYSQIGRLLGVSLSPQETQQIFTRLGLTVEDSGTDGCTVTVPSFRLDLLREVDLIEEVARIYGLTNIPTATPAARIGGERVEDAYYALELVRNELLMLGLYECLTYSTVAVDVVTAKSAYDPDCMLHLKNPLSSEMGVMRPSLLQAILDTVGHNIAHGNTHLALFELGRTYRGMPDDPEERNEAAIALTGLKNPERFSSERQVTYDIFDLRGLLEDWLQVRRISDYTIRPTTHFAFDAGAEVVVNDTVLAVFGQVAHAQVEEMRITMPLFVALVNVDNVLAIQGAPSKYAPLAPFPATSRDVAFIADESLGHQQVIDLVNGIGVKILEKVELF
ncbi:MAG: phenylalanine--tRNA ligase subunit beta, partial [Lentisphaeria bacterium]|nr:phenylalanine--tRNA ligase subunit beta [Lentisphaeria bacterium]